MGVKRSYPLMILAGSSGLGPWKGKGEQVEPERGEKKLPKKKKKKTYFTFGGCGGGESSFSCGPLRVETPMKKGLILETETQTTKKPTSPSGRGLNCPTGEGRGVRSLGGKKGKL